MTWKSDITQKHLHIHSKIYELLIRQTIILLKGLHICSILSIEVYMYI